MYPTIVLLSDPERELPLGGEGHAKLLSCHLTPIVPGLEINEHEHSHWELSFAVEGMMNSFCDGEKICCREDSDTIFIMPPGVMHSRKFGDEKMNCNLSVSFLLSRSRSESGWEEICRKKHYLCEAKGFLRELLYQLRKEVLSYPQNGLLPFLIQSFLLFFIRDFFGLQQEVAAKNCNMWKFEPDCSRAEDIYYFLVDHVSRPGVMNDLMERFGLSLRQLNRIFSAHYGTSLKRAYDQLRLKEACVMLNTSTLDNREIAALLGFTETTGFYVFFKRNMGCTPGEYRRLNMKKS